MIGFSDICIIIPTIGEKMLSQVVISVLSEMPGAEIIVAGFGDSQKVAKAHGVVFFDTQQKTKKPVVLNRVIEFSNKNHLIIVDADILPKPGWGKAMLNGFNAGLGMFSAAIDISRGTTWMRAYNLSSMHEFTHEKPAALRRHLPAFSLAFTRQFFNQIGPFDENLQRSEDFEWSLRAFSLNNPGSFWPVAQVWHLPEGKNSLSGMLKYWILSGPDNFAVRKRYLHILGASVLLRSPTQVLLFAPVLALFATLRIFITSPVLFLRYFYVIPFIYLAKLAWCWGVFEGRKVE